MLVKIPQAITKDAPAQKWDPIAFCRRGPKLSHLFFADDLILMAKATTTNAFCIKEVLTTFCQSSDLSMNLEKSKVFFSRKLNWNLQRCISSALGLSHTFDVGRYLGVPIHHGRVSPRIYRPLIDKVQARLTSWKASLLNIAA
ncbi:hypothetical protein BUALT_Bualt08G0086400 [Buddleja alternifolia]|uniref:Reverse transcriptase n=1 Tax=Buddleja alternifolia TaxID=168488 RepID=A0AAV6X601_9LAMI|nr:hypothetical protein BUALT_Bualt08G0086400 [Buddleja alternifolia]